MRIAERCGAWLLADEVYRGAERETDEVHRRKLQNKQGHLLDGAALAVAVDKSMLSRILIWKRVVVSFGRLEICRNPVCGNAAGSIVVLDAARRLRSGRVHRRLEQSIRSVGAALRLAGGRPAAAAGALPDELERQSHVRRFSSGVQLRGTSCCTAGTPCPHDLHTELPCSSVCLILICEACRCTMRNG